VAGDLELELVEGDGQGGVACHLVHKAAAGGVLKDETADVLAQGEGEEGSMQCLLCIGLHHKNPDNDVALVLID